MRLWKFLVGLNFNINDQVGRNKFKNSPQIEPLAHFFTAVDRQVALVYQFSESDLGHSDPNKAIWECSFLKFFCELFIYLN